MSVTGGDPVFIDGHRKLLQCGHQGINHPFHKLTEEKVMEIRRLKCEQPWLTLREIGKRFEIHESTVGAIVNNRLWKNLPSVDEIRNQ